MCEKTIIQVRDFDLKSIERKGNQTPLSIERDEKLTLIS